MSHGKPLDEQAAFSLTISMLRVGINGPSSVSHRNIINILSASWCPFCAWFSTNPFGVRIFEFPISWIIFYAQGRYSILKKMVLYLFNRVFDIHSMVWFFQVHKTQDRIQKKSICSRSCICLEASRSLDLMKFKLVSVGNIFVAAYSSQTHNQDRNNMSVKCSKHEKSR